MHIYECDLFIIDITPDNISDDKVYFNEHVMIEIEIALSNLELDKNLEWCTSAEKYTKIFWFSTNWKKIKLIEKVLY